MNVPLTYRKRVITQDDLSFIRKVIDDYHSEGRSAISRRLCEAWDWRQVNGHSKTVSAVDFYSNLNKINW